MQDPFYAGLLLQIESRICQTDTDATEAGMPLTDSQVRSAVVKARKMAEGGQPAIAGETPRDLILRDLAQMLSRVPDFLQEARTNAEGQTVRKPIDIKDWIKALETVLDSMKTRKVDQPGSRAYLDFAREFVAEALARQ